MAYNLGLTRYGLKLDFVDANENATSKTMNGFNVLSEAAARNQFGRLVHGVEISNTNERVPGLIDFTFGQTLTAKTMTRQNALEGSDG